jgi:DNA-binding transcriptional regulator GbsR (MarR family)
VATGTPTVPSLRRPAPSSGLVIAGNRPGDIVAFESELVSFFLDAATLLGVPKSVAAVYGIVFASPEPLSFSEISARLNFSNGSVSQALRVLREIGAVRAAEPETMTLDAKAPAARERFVPDLELRKLVGRFLEQRLEKQLDAGSSRLDSLKRTVPAGDRRATVELTRRLASLRDWHTRTRQLLPVARTILRIAP